jgi:preprotein translocase subunit SecD
VEESSLARFLPDSKINLGLDLQGGIHLTLGVDVEQGLAASLLQAGNDLRDAAADRQISLMRPQLGADGNLAIVLLNGDQARQFEALLKDSYSILEMVNSQALSANQRRYTLRYTSAVRQYQADMTLDQAIATIRNRIDQFGVSEPDIRRQADYRIQVQLPGLQDTERAKQLIGQTAVLEFRLVPANVTDEQIAVGRIPPGVDILPLIVTSPAGEKTTVPIAVERTPLLTGEYLADAYRTTGQLGAAEVSLTLTSRGATIFEKITGDYTGRRLAIVLDNVVHSAPVLRERISGGRASISGSFTDSEARDLAIVLRAGSLPAPVEIMEERTVGPSLGQESIDKGVCAALVGGVLVVVVMVIYYGSSGVIADFTLAITMMLLLAGLAAAGATLTLPGLAGIVLTLGMAVDANVLIFERIREETKKGFTPKAAVNAGFEHAMVAIVDSNLTTIIAAVILYQFGSGPVRGFAVTLTLGIAASMFTAVFVSRIIFDIWMGKPGRKLSI